MKNDRRFRAFQIVVLIIAPIGGGFLGVASVGLVTVHKSIVTPLHQEYVLSPIERVKTIQRIIARDEDRSPGMIRNRDNKSNSKDNSKWSNAT